MNKNQIVELIKKTPQIAYDDLKNQAIEVGVPVDLFDAAWLEVHSKKRNIKRLILIILIPAFVIAGVIGDIAVNNYLLTREIRFESGEKTFADCLEIGQKSANKWSKKYSLLDFGMANQWMLHGTSTGKEAFCYVEFVDANNGDMLQVIISPDKIEPDITNYFNEKIIYIPIPNIINSTDILERAKNDFKISAGSDYENNQIALDKLSYDGRFESDQHSKDDPYIWTVKILNKQSKAATEIKYNAVTGEVIDKYDFKTGNAGTPTNKPKAVNTVALKITKIEGTWEEWLSKLEKVRENMYLENFDSGIKSAQACLGIGNARAKSWSENYKLVGLSVDRLDQESINNGLSSNCETLYQSGANDESLKLSFGELGITYTIGKNTIQEDHFVPLSAPTEIIDTDKISEQLIKEGLRTDERISSFTLIYDRNKQKYVWLVIKADKSQISKDAM